MSDEKKKPFGGYAITFADRPETLDEVFGDQPLSPGEMTSKLWAFVKRNGLAIK